VELPRDAGARRVIMSPAWPKRINSGDGRVTSRNAQKTGFSKGRIWPRLWPVTKVTENASACLASNTAARLRNGRTPNCCVDLSSKFHPYLAAARLDATLFISSWLDEGFALISAMQAFGPPGTSTW
jgi:hypothetical protein